MRWKTSAILLTAALALAACNASETLESVDVSKVQDKDDHPLSPAILADIRARGMDRNSPIMIRILKEEGVLEIWKARRDNRFEKLKEYQICAWSGRLGPKVKEGDRQAPEGFYSLSPYHLNPRSSYYLAINTGFPNRFDAANRRTGSNLMIHGACSSSGCYSMTDAQILEIYAFARDAFKGGQQTIQLQALPFRMTAENMARHRLSEHNEFWKMLKVGYDQFEITKRPPEVNVCEKKYVFNQQPEGNAKFNPTGACPPMSTPPALASAMKSYELAYAKDYGKAMKKYDGKIWYDPTEAERKALVAKQRKANDLAYAPTGSALKAGKLLSIEEFEKAAMAKAEAAKAAEEARQAAAVQPSAAQAASVPVPTPNPVKSETAAAPQPPKKSFWNIFGSGRQQAAEPAPQPAAPASAAQASPQSRQQDQTPQAVSGVAVPQPNPTTTPENLQTAAKKPFWKFWVTQ
ncbi:murein L,D-transpeptidase family protein [Ciceribacter sp. L1K22]|uniref:L,D-transpeptidase family protein n=1 Tax=Ciceribacter sp. L1K22 TaxID=2820275 RepID=UPI001FEEC203|nr:murein L,D-transpeptidase family protein [Ciceribacter sp. L1K22]